MQYNINGKEYTYLTNIKDNQKLRQSFNALSEKTFGLNFDPWYENGYWGEQYIPHVLLDRDRVVANVSVNIIDTLWKNQSKRYIQLGTVMTDCEYRQRGLSRWLIERILETYKEECDAIYLFANDSALDFYPKFGFVKRNQYQCQIPIIPKVGQLRLLDMSSKEDKALLIEKYRKSNPFSALPMEENVGLLMFYCSQFLKDNVYYIEKYDAIVIMEQEDENMICYDIFCDANNDLENLLSTIARAQTKNILLGFTPKKSDSYENFILKGEDTLFVLEEAEDIFAGNKIMFPLLSHA